jgi:hypothetical protein
MVSRKISYTYFYLPFPSFLEIFSSERKQIESNKSKSKEIDKPKDFES